MSLQGGSTWSLWVCPFCCLGYGYQPPTSPQPFPHPSMQIVEGVCRQLRPLHFSLKGRWLPPSSPLPVCIFPPVLLPRWTSDSMFTRLVDVGTRVRAAVACRYLPKLAGPSFDYSSVLWQLWNVRAGAVGLKHHQEGAGWIKSRTF